jgi:putative membrane protein
MASADAGYARSHPKRVTAVLSVVGYALVVSAFEGVVPLFPQLSRETVLLFSDAIAVVNTLALTSILAGVAFIKRGEVRKHRAAMLTAFGLICAFLVLYLWKVGGGFEKSIVIRETAFLGQYAGTVELAYLLMLAVHILLSVVAVPVVLYAVILGLTHTPEELRETSHAKYGRIAVASWAISLFLGVVTYLMLNHVYAWVPR